MVYERTVNPPGLVTRSISSAMVHGSRTCSATFDEKQMSTLLSRNGSAMPDPRTEPDTRSPAACISDGSGSTET